jgi:hypothetical protein
VSKLEKKEEMVPPKRGTALVQHESGSHYVMDMHQDDRTKIYKSSNLGIASNPMYKLLSVKEL